MSRAGTLDEPPRLLRRQNADAWQGYAEEIEIVLTNPAIGDRYDLQLVCPHQVVRVEC
jgi:hypothetical protein